MRSNNVMQVTLLTLLIIDISLGITFFVRSTTMPTDDLESRLLAIEELLFTDE